jgi:hypothetical protein
MKGAIKTEEIHGTNYDIMLMGSEESLEAQSIMMSLIIDSGMPTDGEISPEAFQMYMMKGLTRPIVKRIKELFINCIKAPVINDDSFSDIAPETITILFNQVYEYLTKKASKKKVSSVEL